MTRVILHLDCDCFYAQVELQRLRLPSDTPLVVVQWGSTLAVSYAARPFGIKRGDKVADIARKAGDAVTIVTVETIGGEKESENPSDETVDLSAPASVILKNTEKVSLARYRNASMAVFDVIASMLPPSSAFERASIDEVFLDISAHVQSRVSRRGLEGALGTEAADRVLPENTLILGEDSCDTGSLQDESLFEGARYAAELRHAVQTKIGYTMSAGIASNKMLAKYASACNKPNKQTVVLPCAVEGLLATVPITSFRGCGGKIGKTVVDMGFESAAVCFLLSLALHSFVWQVDKSLRLLLY